MMTSVASVVNVPVLHPENQICVCVVMQKVFGCLCSYGLANVQGEAVIALVMFIATVKFM